MPPLSFGESGFTFGVPEVLPVLEGYETAACADTFLRVKKDGQFYFLLDRGDRWELWPEKFDAGLRRPGNPTGSYAAIDEKFYLAKTNDETSAAVPK